MVDDEYLVLTEDEPEAPDSAEALAPWLLLVVDDVPDVIDVTRRVLDGCDFQGRRIELLSAGSAAAEEDALGPGHGQPAVVTRVMAGLPRPVRVRARSFWVVRAPMAQRVNAEDC